ncbi:UNVERIFIED_CONTAM: hypothetical protein Sindi_0931100 [Sesamum indicum]
MQGEWFTWHNYSASPRNLWKRLDRILTNDIWMLTYPTLSYTCLTPRTSNHSPLVISGDSQRQFGGMFRFDNYFTLSPSFISRVKQIWQHEIVGIPIYAVTQKLKALKPIFRELRREKGNLSHNVQLAKGFHDMAQNLRAKMQWMKEGDQCRRVFFRKIAHRRAVKRVLQINDGHGVTQTDPNVVKDKAQRPDGYWSGFFKAAWTVMGDEVTRAVLNFFATGKLLKQVNCTLLAVIPKVHSPITVANFRPISCCNVIYKVIAKLLVQRLSVVLGKLVSPCQATFIPGRSIGDNILMAQELFTRYNQKRLSPRCALKMDIRKAYDTVE